MIVVIVPLLFPTVLYRNGCYVVRCSDGLLFFLFLFSLGLTELWVSNHGMKPEGKEEKRKKKEKENYSNDEKKEREAYFSHFWSFCSFLLIDNGVGAGGLRMSHGQICFEACMIFHLIKFHLFFLLFSFF